MIIKPMLAGNFTDRKDKLEFPIYISPKLDGIRCLKVNGEIVSRTFKLIPNNWIRETLKILLPEGADGEIITGNTFSECSGNVMREDGEPRFYFYWFDYVLDDPEKQFLMRQIDLVFEDKKFNAENKQYTYTKLIPEIRKRGKLITPATELKLPMQTYRDTVVPWISKVCRTSEELYEYEQQYINDGFEGLMIRNGEGPYKFGRSTAKEGYLLKMKRFEDSEAIIIGMEEQLHNANEAEEDAFGRTKRSSHQENLIPTGKMGRLLVKDEANGWEFGIGTGFDSATRQEMWDNKNKYIGKLAKYKYQKEGMKDVPRIPVFIGIRDSLDK
jgi:DNA ligase 1